MQERSSNTGWKTVIMSSVSCDGMKMGLWLDFVFLLLLHNLRAHGVVTVAVKCNEIGDTSEYLHVGCSKLCVFPGCRVRVKFDIDFVADK
ncbi:hypothetical protein MRB53_021957 [Persea americana]|uniref:Uncharacterized protein n=1 Tax=Persea americana TaxID=3435 RepID=A0ACC2L6H6_PERAE|nr:hypothetical protein MRB53_021957 [Persea americana]